MSKHILLYIGILVLVIAFIGLYLGYAPKAGPIGNGPNYKLIWINFSSQFVIGLASLLRGIMMFKREKAINNQK